MLSIKGVHKIKYPIDINDLHNMAKRNIIINVIIYHPMKKKVLDFFVK